MRSSPPWVRLVSAAARSLGFAWNAMPSPAFSIRPWIAPRLDVLRVSPDGGESETLTDFGVSAGIELTTISGLGIHAAYDWVSRDGGEPAVFDIGLQYAIRVPGL